MATFNLVEEPEHMVAEPDNIDAVGAVFKVMVGVPLKPEPAFPLASVTDTSEYVVVEDGDTVILFPLT